MFKTVEERRTAEVALTVIRQFERKLGNAEELRQPEIQRQIAAEVKALTQPTQATLEGFADTTPIERIVEAVTQTVARIRSYLEGDAEVENVLLRNGRQLAEFIFAQMMQHYAETPLGEEDYEVRVTRGFTLLQPQPFNVVPGQAVRDFRQAVTPASEIKRHVFAGFKKCFYPLQKFDSDPERRFAVLVDADPSMEKWLKPGRAQFQIEYRSGQAYEPGWKTSRLCRKRLGFVFQRSTLPLDGEGRKRKASTTPQPVPKIKIFGTSLSV